MDIGPTPTLGQARQEMLARMPVAKLLWKLTLPAMAGMMTMSLYYVVDTIFIGRGVGSTAIAGVTIVFPLIMLMMALGLMIGTGAASAVSRNLGAGDVVRAERILGNAITLSVLLGLVVIVVCVPNSAGLLRLFGASPTILPYAREYADIIILGAVFAIYPMVVNNLARAEGNANVAMKNMILGAVLNIVLDPLFIFGLQLGVRGAAIATVVSQVVTTVYVTRYFVSGKSTLHFRMKYLRLELPVAGEVLSVGFPSLVRMGSASILVLIINRTLGVFGGDLSIAAFGIVNRSMVFVAMPLLAIAQGLQPILGFSYGSGRYDRALGVTVLALKAASLLSLGAFLGLMVFTAPVMSVFTTDAALISEGVHAARRVFFVFFLVGFQIVGSTVFQALGKVTKTFVTSTSRQVLFLVPLVVVLPRFIGTDGIWLAFPIADALSFLLVFLLIAPQLREFKHKAGAGSPGPSG